MGEYRVGQVIELNDGRRGRIRYVGSFHLKPGEWIGIELEDASGKNDGEVQGKRYFDCDANCGMFVQGPGIAAVLEQAPPAAANTRTAAVKRPGPGPGTAAATTAAAPAAARGARASGLGRPSSINGTTALTAVASSATKRQSLLDGSRARQTLNAGSPTPAARPAAARSAAATARTSTRPSVTPTSATAGSSTASGALSGTAAKRTSLAGRSAAATASATAPTAGTRSVRTSTLGTATSRTSLAPANAATRRPAPRPTSLQASRNVPSTAAATATATARAATQQQRLASKPGTADEKQDDGHSQEQDGKASDAEAEASTTHNQPAAETVPKDVEPRSGYREPTSAGLSRPTTQQLSAQNRKIDDLETKLRVMEKQQLESRDRLRDMDKIQTERDRFENIIQKLQAKIQPQVEEIQSLRKDLKETTAKLEVLEKSDNEHDEVIEMATLDKEMAEEMAESYKFELDALRSKHEELVLEVDILKAENEDLGREMSPEERSSMGFAQLEKSNERLKEALIRLREMTEDTESDLRARITELQDAADNYATVEGQLLESQENLKQADALVDDLKQRLETAQGSEEMIEELTEKNMELTEQTAQLKGEVQELREVIEIGDEISYEHEQNVASMQDDIDHRDSLLLESARKSSEQDQAIEELDYSIGRYRDLVKDLNAELEELRASQQITEAEHSELSHRSKAMMDMNLRLQQSASKAQAKFIDNELRRLDAQESADELVIVRRFLPDTYLRHKDSTAAFLAFKRVTFKSTLLHGSIKERLNSDAVPGHEEDVFLACELLDKLTWVSHTCQRFVRFIMSCSLEPWERLSGAAHDLEPVERAFNAWIDALKRDEFKDEQCKAELQRTISVLEHLGERFFGESLVDYAEEVHLRAVQMQNQLDAAAIAISQIKAIAKARVVLPTDADEDDEQQVQTFNANADQLTAQVRSLHVMASKSIQQLDELTARSLTLEPSTQNSVEGMQQAVDAFAKSCRAAGSKIASIVNDDSRTESLSYEHISHVVSDDNTAPFSALLTQATSTSTAVQSFSTLTSTLSSTLEFETQVASDNLDAKSTPWAQLEAQARARDSAAADRDAEFARLNDTLSERTTALAIKDKTISELGVTIEVLQKRADDGAKAVTRVRESEIELEAAVQKRDTLQEEIQQKHEEIRLLRAERENWKTAGMAAGGIEGNVQFDEAQMAQAMENMIDGGFVPARVSQELDFLRAELEATKAIIRQLRQAATDASFQGACSDGILEPLPATEPVDRRREEALFGEKTSLDAMKALRQLVKSSSTGIFKLPKRERSERLKWRPAQERLGWHVGIQREEWEQWKQLAHDTAKSEERRVDQQLRIDRATNSSRENKTARSKHTLARLHLPVPSAEGKDLFGVSGGEIEIVDPVDWDRLGTRLGLVV